MDDALVRSAYVSAVRTKQQTKVQNLYFLF